MSGDWIKMRCDLLDDPAVFKLSTLTKLDRFAVAGRLLAFWAWADRHAVDGHVDGAASTTVDDVVRHDGFADALCAVGWLIVDLGLWVLREACRQGRAWLDAGLPRRSVSVNVSPAQIWSGDFETAVSAVLAETDFPAELLCLELTESLFVDHTEQRISRTLTALSGLGVRLALDDFGSGYSSLGYLTRLPFDWLKVDRTFVDGISSAPEKRKLLGGIIALSHGLGMKVVAEGAELPPEVDVLRGLDCDLVQGFVFSPPITPDQAPLVAAGIEREACRTQPNGIASRVFNMSA